MAGSISDENALGNLTEGLKHRLRLETRFALNLWSLGALLLGAVLFLPLAIILLYLFQPPGDLWGHLASTVLFDYIFNSIVLVAGAGLVATVTGVTTAWLVTACDYPGRRIFEWALILPLAFPTYIAAYAYSNTLDALTPFLLWLQNAFGPQARYHFEGGLVYAVLILIFSMVLYPYVYLLSRASFSAQTGSILESARLLGNGPARTFFRVALPLARPGIVAGLSLVIMEILNDYGAVTFFGVPTLTTGIFRAWLAMGNVDGAVRIAACLMSFVFAVILLERAQRGRARYHDTGRQHRVSPPYSLRGMRAGAAAGACCIPLLFGFVLPTYQLGYWAFHTAAEVLEPEFVRLILNSFLLAIGAAGLITLLALFLAYAARLQNTLALRLTTKLAFLGYAIPGAVIAVGVLIPFGRLDRAINQWIAADVGLVFSGTLVAVVFAYGVRFIAVALQTVESGLHRTGRHVNETARLLGASPIRALVTVDMPMIQAYLVSAMILVFVDLLKELPLTLILRPFNFDTLATRTFGLAAQGRIPEAATPALIIVATGVLPVILLNRYFNRSGT